jgi:hypothetical protein
MAEAPGAKAKQKARHVTKPKATPNNFFIVLILPLEFIIHAIIIRPSKTQRPVTQKHSFKFHPVSHHLLFGSILFFVCQKPTNTLYLCIFSPDRPYILPRVKQKMKRNAIG